MDEIIFKDKDGKTKMTLKGEELVIKDKENKKKKKDKEKKDENSSSKS